MPGDQSDLSRVRSAVVTDASRRDVENPSSPTAQYVKRVKIRKKGKKIKLISEDNLNDFLEVDYNPTVLPFSKVINWNDKTVISGEKALEFKGIGRREFTWQFLFTDFGYHREKTPEETVLAKLNWLEDRSGVSRRFIDGEPVDIPQILLLQKEDDVIRVVILKIEGQELFLKENFDPDRAVVNITFRKVVRERRLGRLRRRMF